MAPIGNPANSIEEKALVDPAVKKTKESLIKNLQAKKTKKLQREAKAGNAEGGMGKGIS